MPQASCWQIDGSLATCSCAQISLQLNLDAPQEGAAAVEVERSPSDFRLWRWGVEDHSPVTLGEVYARQQDLVAHYQTAGEAAFHTRAVWEVTSGHPEQAMLLNLSLSIRTPLLDTRPVYWVESVLAGEGAYVSRNASDEFQAIVYPNLIDHATVVETVQSGDLLDPAGPVLQPTQQGACCRWRLFDQFLEKGVIRTARLSLAIAPGNLSEDQVSQLASYMQSQPAELTT